MIGAKGGRPRKPTQLKALEGNPGKRPLNKREPKPAKAIPPCPKHLNDVAKKEWKLISKHLFDLGLLTEIDRTALAAYCQSYARWVEAEQQVAKTPLVVMTKTGYPVQNPYLSIANKAMEQMRAFLGEFGMTPASRSRVTSTKELESDPMEGYLRRAKKNNTD